jgi:hypothetical protein
MLNQQLVKKEGSIFVIMIVFQANHHEAIFIFLQKQVRGLNHQINL